MSKDGFFFILLILLIAWIGGTFITILSSLVIIVVSMMAIPLVIGFTLDRLRSAGVKLPKAIDIKGTDIYTLCDSTLPSEFLKLEEKLLISLGALQEPEHVVINKFLVLINACNANEQIAPCMRNGIAKKMMFEYHRKYGSLDFRYDKTHLLEPQEVLRVLTPQEKIDFQTFCLKTDI